MKQKEDNIRLVYGFASRSMDYDTKLLDKISTANDIDKLEGKELDKLYAMCISKKKGFPGVGLTYIEDTTLPEAKKDNLKKILNTSGDFSTNIIKLKIFQCEEHIGDFIINVNPDSLDGEPKNLYEHLLNRLFEQKKPYQEELFIAEHSREGKGLTVEYENQYKEVKEALATSASLDRVEWRKQSKFNVAVALYVDDVMEAAKNPSKSTAIEKITKLNEDFVKNHSGMFLDKDKAKMLEAAKIAAVSFVTNQGGKDPLHPLKQFFKSWVGASDLQKIDKAFAKLAPKTIPEAKLLIQNITDISSPLQVSSSPTRYQREVDGH